MAQKPFIPTSEQRAVVKALSAYGCPQDHIASVIGCHENTLKNHFKPEISFGLSEANAKVAETCFKMAISGQHPAATFFWLKTRAKWREQHREDANLNVQNELRTTAQKLRLLVNDIEDLTDGGNPAGEAVSDGQLSDSEMDET